MAGQESIDGVEFEAGSFMIRSKRITVKGEVDAQTAPKLIEQIHTALKRNPQVIILNLAGVTRMDTSGVAILLEGIQIARKAKVILSLQDVSKAAQSVLEIARVDKLFQVSGNNYVPPGA